MKKKYISSQISPLFEDAHYSCWDCSKEFFEDDMELDIVECPHCGGNMIVYATANSWNYCLKRKYVKDIEKGNLILLRDFKSYQVLNVQESDTDYGIYKVALKGYRTVNLEEGDWVECIWGTWDSKEE